MKKAYGYAAVSILMWSTVATVSKLLLGTMTSYQVLCVSALFASAFLLVVNVVTGNIKKLKSYRPRDYLTMVLISLPGTFLYYVFYYSGTAIMPASQAFIVNYLWPIMCVVFACIILKEKLTARRIAAFAVSFAGVMLVVGNDLLHFDKNTLTGAALCVLDAVCYGVFTALSRKMNYDKRISLMVGFFVSFLLAAVINLLRGDVLALGGFQILGLAFNGIGSFSIATVCWMLALDGGKTAKVANLAYITPFLSLIWTSVFLKESISLWSVAGLVVIVLGIFIQLKDTEKVADG